MNDVSIVIPARYDSSRFPGKPLAKINGKEMILHVCDGCAPAFGKNFVFVVTDDIRIFDTVAKSGYTAIMTEKKQVLLTGSDRTAYASQTIDSEYIIEVQGDEPLINYEDIRDVYQYLKMGGESIINCYQICIADDNYLSTKDGVTFITHNNFENKNTIKVITTEDDYLQYMSRQPIPTNCKEFKKQVCIYGWDKTALVTYFGEDKNRSPLEIGEDIHILRMLENYDIKMLEVKGNYQSVDIPDDVGIVERILNDRD